MTNTPATEPAESGSQGPAGSSAWSDMSDSPSTTTSTSTSESTEPSPPAARDEDLLGRTRVSQMWIGIIVFALVLILLLVFVLENTKRVEITYFGFTGHMPLAVAMLLSAVAGILLTAIAGTLRILQLRRRVKKSQAR